MKNRSFQKLLVLIAVLATSAFCALNVVAQDASAATQAANTTPAADAVQAAPQLSYGVPQVLQLAKAKVSESTIIAYIQNSGTVYNLDASQIVYLKQQGVSDAVIDTMINQRSRALETAAQNASQANSASTTTAQTATVVTQPETTYIETVPSSTVYVVPDTQTYNYYNYYHRPYYYPSYGYYGWSYPAVSFSFGFGGGNWGGYRGGYHYGGGGSYHYNNGGGYRGGGGFRGGGGHHR